MKSSVKIFKKIQDRYAQEGAISELKKLINFYNKSSPSILARVTFLKEVDLDSQNKPEKMPASVIGIIKKLALNRNKLKLKLLISVGEKGFNTEFSHEINLEDMIQIEPLKTAPDNNPFSKKAKNISEEYIGEGERNGK